MRLSSTVFLDSEFHYLIVEDLLLLFGPDFFFHPHPKPVIYQLLHDLYFLICDDFIIVTTAHFVINCRLLALEWHVDQLRE